MPIYPKILKKGDLVGLVAPASPPFKASYIDKVISVLERKGFRVIEGRSLRKRHGFLAGTDKERASDLMSMFANSKVKAIFCLRGGYGCGRILSLLDYKLIARSPKIFLGFSDITALHMAISKKSKLISFHGPVGTSLMKNPSGFSWDTLERTLMSSRAPGSLLQGLGKKDQTLEVIRNGEATGRLIGGNLSVLAASIGTDYLPSFKGKILLIEEIDERPYAIDRLLTQFLNTGLLQKVSGIMLGAFISCDHPSNSKSREYKQSYEDVLYERLYSLGVPVLKGLPIGHQDLNACVPIGAKVRLCAGRKSDLIIEEAVVRD
ncbi:MAG: LD-carboxypeptidase [SAR324 cluster bacterium]|uniref:LD-carboxypeptidase n=1 Tax=SAR324 cluster bacterium TaxID=2024889 RepID=A0A7X9FS48_9DELT|nr:LD-carboxypeptidase [SAR324 cluster bacterium]